MRPYTKDLSPRCSIALTLILAMNVLKLIVNRSSPKTDYLTPMHEFIITSTFFVVIATLARLNNTNFSSRSRGPGRTPGTSFYLCNC